MVTRPTRSKVLGSQCHRNEQREKTESLLEIGYKWGSWQERGTSFPEELVCKAYKGTFANGERPAIGKLLGPMVIISGCYSLVDTRKPQDALLHGQHSLGLLENRNSMQADFKLLLLILPRQSLLPDSCFLSLVCFPRKRDFSLRVWELLILASDQWLYRT